MVLAIEKPQLFVYNRSNILGFTTREELCTIHNWPSPPLSPNFPTHPKVA
jgi:hypothetical protein